MSSLGLGLVTEALVPILGLADYVEPSAPPLPCQGQASTSSQQAEVPWLLWRCASRAGVGRSLLLETPRGWQWQDGENMKEETMNSFLPCFDNGRALWID